MQWKIRADCVVKTKYLKFFSEFTDEPEFPHLFWKALSESYAHFHWLTILVELGYHLGFKDKESSYVLFDSQTGQLLFGYSAPRDGYEAIDWMYLMIEEVSSTITAIEYCDGYGWQQRRKA